MPYGVSLGVLLFSRLGYIQSITVTNGLILSLFITFYVWEFYLLLARRLRLRPASAALLSLVFLLLHFLIFRRELSGNSYLFRANDVTCVYYYVIPGLLNCALVLPGCAGLHRPLLGAEGLAQRPSAAGGCYLAVFSNLFESAILAGWCGLELLPALLRQAEEARLRRPSCGSRASPWRCCCSGCSASGSRAGAAGRGRQPPALRGGPGRVLGALPGFFLGGMYGLSCCSCWAALAACCWPWLRAASEGRSAPWGAAAAAAAGGC